MKNKYLLFHIVLIIGIVLIITGLLLTIVQCEETIKQQQYEIKKLHEQNDYLWNNYYMNVTNKDNYEYYE